VLSEGLGGMMKFSYLIGSLTQDYKTLWNYRTDDVNKCVFLIMQKVRSWCTFALFTKLRDFGFSWHKKVVSRPHIPSDAEVVITAIRLVLLPTTRTHTLKTANKSVEVLEETYLYF
jgi:hypothetical protein